MLQRVDVNAQSFVRIYVKTQNGRNFVKKNRWCSCESSFLRVRVKIAKNRQPTIPSQTDSTHARSYTTYSTYNSSYTGLLHHKRGPTRSCYVWHRQPIQHAAFLHMLRYSAWRYCTAPNSPQTDFTRARFNTTHFCTSVFQHNPFLHISFSPQSWSCITVLRFCTRIYLRWVR